MIRILTLATLLALTAAPAMAVSFCFTPQDGRAHAQIGAGIKDETEKAAYFEMLLRKEGIDARNTRMWNECVQTFVREDGKTTMRIYDPFTLEEIED